LWGELVPNAQLTLAARWYGKAIEYLPCYVKARVHLAEIYLQCQSAKNAEDLLIPALFFIGFDTPSFEMLTHYLASEAGAYSP
jgi:hypothetical protein